MILKFTDEITIEEVIKMLINQSFSLRVVSKNKESINKTIESWNVTSVGTQEITVQMNFTAPGSISPRIVSLYYYDNLLD
jgi:hypothetical protein